MVVRIREAQGMDPDPDVEALTSGRFLGIAVPAERY